MFPAKAPTQIRAAKKPNAGPTTRINSVYSSSSGNRITSAPSVSKAWRQSSRSCFPLRRNPSRLAAVKSTVEAKSLRRLKAIRAWADNP